jgi:hypothetical protein
VLAVGGAVDNVSDFLEGGCELRRQLRLVLRDQYAQCGPPRAVLNAPLL